MGLSNWRKNKTLCFSSFLNTSKVWNALLFMSHLIIKAILYERQGECYYPHFNIWKLRLRARIWISLIKNNKTVTELRFQCNVPFPYFFFFFLKSNLVLCWYRGKSIYNKAWKLREKRLRKIIISHRLSLSLINTCGYIKANCLQHLTQVHFISEWQILTTGIQREVAL